MINGTRKPSPYQARPPSSGQHTQTAVNVDGRGHVMKVGIPREVKNHEYRVAITPSGVNELVRNGHQVYVEAEAGLGSSIPDRDYVAAGAEILAGADDVWAEGDLILKVKE